MSNVIVSVPFTHANVINTAEAAARLEFLVDIARPLTEAEFAECSAIVRLRDALVKRWGEQAWVRGMRLISDEYWDKHAAMVAHTQYGAAVFTPWWRARRFASYLEEQYWEVMFDGRPYWGLKPKD